MAKKNMNIFWAKLIIDELIRNGIDYFCICPGSRSTPLTLAIAENKKANTLVCIDERGAAFHALGYGRATNKPAVIIITSGTAVANLYPAIIEAATDNIPMIILSADRPHELIDTASNQTIHQPNIFGQYTRWQYDFPCPDENFPPEAVLTTIDQGIFQSLNNPGPIHINCRYRQPFEPPTATIKASYIKNIKHWQNSIEPFTKYERAIATPDSNAIKSLADSINNAKRPMLIIGKLTNDNERQVALKIINKLNCPVYADITSGLRLTDCSTNIIRYFDQQLLSTEFNKKAKPDLVLHLGSRVTSKRVNDFFAQNRPAQYIIVKNNAMRSDPAHIVTMHIQADLTIFSQKLANKLKPKNNSFAKFYANKAKQVDRLIATTIANEKIISEAFIARQISIDIPNNSSLFVSNSMPIRDMDLYSVAGRKAISIAANRGVSGIDGIISTAAGFATAKQQPTTLLIGDLAFIHDINALSMIQKLNLNIVIIIVNNNGGGIFHFLPVSKCNNKTFEKYFATSHDFSFKGVCETFKIDYCKVSDKASFADTYRQAIKTANPVVIEVVTDRELNLKSRRTIKKQIINTLEQGINK